MLKEKAKKFWREHKDGIIIFGGGVILSAGLVAIAVACGKMQESLEPSYPIKDNKWLQADEDDVVLASKYNGTFEEGSAVPFVSKEMAHKFVEEEGNIYQISKFTEDGAVLWISQNDNATVVSATRE